MTDPHPQPLPKGEGSKTHIKNSLKYREANPLLWRGQGEENKKSRTKCTAFLYLNL
ncbi:hypothetical protein DEU42_11363 [Flavobacterium sp. AG291]|nr:hypothetical protein DEU42_11363 [Flavobacterium sp. AG291]